MQCPRCQQENRTGAKFCEECGTPLRRTNASGSPGASYADLERALIAAHAQTTEALEQQTATREILRVISSSPTDVEPVFQTILNSTNRLCEASFSVLWLWDGEALISAAHANVSPELAERLRTSRARPRPGGSPVALAALEQAVIHVPDVLDDPRFSPADVPSHQLEGARSILAVPMLREGTLVGVINTWRREPRAFTDRQVELLQTFADQAVIAIENVRLFKELEARNRDLAEALEQQTATSEILRVISSSPTDVQPVFDTIVESAVRLCNGAHGNVYTFDGELLHHAAEYNATPKSAEFTKATFPRRPGRDLGVGRAILERDVVHVLDVEQDPEFSQTLARARGFRSALAVPLLREGSPIGAIAVTRHEPGPFSKVQIELLRTFADQAVIAIENARLFNELEEKNRALTAAHAQVTEALEQQTATAEVLRIISTSPTELQPVLEVVVKSAVRFCGADDAIILRLDGENLRAAAHHGPIPVDFGLPVPCVRGTVGGRSVLERRAVHVTDLQAEAEEFPEGSTFAKRLGARTTLGVPLLREGAAVGTIQLRRAEVNPFTDKQIALLKTFADQAVIAIENVRLFRDLTESLEQQTATSEILRVISTSPTDVQPVFESLVVSAARLCGANDLLLLIREADVLRPAAGVGSFWEGLTADFRVPLVRGTVAARSAIDGATLHFADLATLPEADFPVGRDLQRRFGHHTVLAVPLMREGVALGTIFAMRFEVRPFVDHQIALLKTFADQAVIAIENVRLFNETKEALEQQTATSDILQVISSSPTDVQPVFDIIGERAERLCAAEVSVVSRVDGEWIQLMALHGVAQEGVEHVRRGFPMRSDAETVTARAVRNCAVIHVPDVFADPQYEQKEAARVGGYRGCLGVPMVRERQVIGVIFVARATPGYFADTQVELLKTFAEQAVIAIENVRLFKELEEKNRALTESHAQVTEALEQQTATAEILRVISRSQTDVQPVFDTIVRSAVRLCDGLFGTLLQFDGELLHHVAQHNYTPEALGATHRMFPARPTRAFGAGRAILERAVVHIPDIDLDPEYQNQAVSHAVGFRSGLFVPMLREGAPIGVIGVARAEPGPFSDSEIELLKTFADQAVIAIQNVRLFTELQASNRELTTALDTQTATSDILRVISRSQTDVQPVFDAIVDSAARLLRGNATSLSRIEGDQIALAAMTSTDDPGDASQRARFPMSIHSEEDHAQAVRNRAPLNSHDAHSDPRLPETQHASARLRGYRSLVVVPLVRHDEAVGALGVSRPEPGGFTDDEIALLQTFADQAVIAIENARLLSELQTRTGELTQSVEQLTALGEVSRAVSSTLDVETVLDTIVSRASQLAGAAGCSIYEYDEGAEQFELRATHNDDTEFVEALRAVPLRKGEGLMGRAAQMREPIQIPDITQPGAYQSSVRDTLIRFGYHALLAVPLLREDQIIGSLSFNRKAAGEFPPEVVDVLKTFATQSALAIQNARLFREIADKSAQLEVASQHKSEFLANMSHELRTPLNAIIGFSEVLAQGMFGAINEKQTEYLQDILESGRHLLSLINDILDLSKIEAGRMELESSDFDLPSAIENALVLVRERASRRGIRLGSTIDTRLGMISGDERKVKQVLLNLLSNALKFTPEGGQIDVTARLLDDRAEVSVADTGIGIAPTDQDAVFEEFRQVGTADKKAEGTGLGLALSRKFIELHGGRIWVTSQVGVGSTFAFTLPLRTE